MSDSMGGGVTKLAEGLREVITDAVQEGLRPVEKRLDGVDNRLDGVENRLDGIEKEVTRGFEVVNQGFRALGALDPAAEPTKSKSGAAQTSVLPMAAKDR